MFWQYPSLLALSLSPSGTFRPGNLSKALVSSTTQPVAAVPAGAPVPPATTELCSKVTYEEAVSRLSHASFLLQ